MIQCLAAYQTSMLQPSYQPCSLKVANHSSFTPVPQSTPFHGSIKGDLLVPSQMMCTSVFDF